jgi:hypothetical protein
MKNEQLRVLMTDLRPLQATEEQQIKGGYGRIPGTRVNSRNTRWDDIPFRLVRPRNNGLQKEAAGTWTGLVKDSFQRP